MTKKVNYVLGEIDIPTLVVLRARDDPVRVRASDADDGILEVDVRPLKRKDLALAHAGLEGDKEDGLD